MPILHDVDRPSLYRAPINLWVEDELTRAYLSAVWNDPDVAYLIAGGNEGVTAVVNDAEKANYPNVFGLIDRDYRESNKPSWFDPNKTFRRFILPVHEIENYLLDADALAASRYNNLRKSTDEILAFMKAKADRLCWWAACREVIAELKRRFRANFISDPSPEIGETEARNHICNSPWFQKLAAGASRTTASDITSLLSAAYTTATDRLVDENESWRLEFAGKEILRDIGSRIYHRESSKSSPKQAEFDADLAKEIAAWQVENSAVPQDIIDLLDALKQRIGAAPRPEI